MLDFSKDNNYFCVEEKNILNHIGFGVGKDDCCNHLMFSINISNDEINTSLLNEVLTKIQNLSNQEWDELQNYLPFDVPFSDDDVEKSEDVN